MNQTPRLTGPYDTGSLPAITPHPVTLVVARRPRKEALEDFVFHLERLHGATEESPGCLGSGILAPGPGDSYYHIIARFEDAVSLRSWETSQTREELLKDLLPYVDDVAVAAAPSTDAFFDALASTSSAPSPVKHTIDLLWAFPAALVVAILFAPHIASMPVLLRVLVSMAVGTLSYAALILPLRRYLAKRANRRAPLR